MTTIKAKALRKKGTDAFYFHDFGKWMYGFGLADFYDSMKSSSLKHIPEDAYPVNVEINVDADIKAIGRSNEYVMEAIKRNWTHCENCGNYYLSPNDDYKFCPYCKSKLQ